MTFPVKALVYMIGKMFNHGNQGNPSNHGLIYMITLITGVHNHGNQDNPSNHGQGFYYYARA